MIQNSFHRPVAPRSAAVRFDKQVMGSEITKPFHWQKGEYEHPSPYLGWRQSDFNDPGAMARSSYSKRVLEPGSHYDEMRYRSSILFGVTERLFDQVLACDRYVQPSATTAQAIDILEATVFMLGRLGELETAERDLLKAITHGVSFIEIIWEILSEGTPWDGLWFPAKLLYKDLWNFGFERSKIGPVTCVRVGGKLIPIPADKYMWWAQGGGSSPWGFAAYDAIHADHHDLLYNSHFRDAHARKWARPAAATGFDPADEGSEKEMREEDERRIATSLKIADGVHADGKIAYNREVYHPHIVGSNQAGGGAPYSETEKDLTRNIERALIGESSSAIKKTGARAADEVSERTVNTKVRLRAKGTTRLISSQLCAPFARLNWGRGAPASSLICQTLDLKQRGQLMAGIDLADRMGLHPPKSHVSYVTGVPIARDGEPVLKSGGQ